MRQPTTAKTVTDEEPHTLQRKARFLAFFLLFSQGWERSTTGSAGEIGAPVMTVPGVKVRRRRGKERSAKANTM